MAASPLSRFVFTTVVSWVLAAAMTVYLIVRAGPWNLLSNTRLLDTFIEAGVIGYHDEHIGIIEGVPDHKYYLKSQDPIDPGLIALAVGLYAVLWLVSAWRYRQAIAFAARPHDLAAPRGAIERAYWFGTGLGRWFPFRLRAAATEEALVADGVGREAARQGDAVHAHATALYQVVLFTIVGFVLVGFGPGVRQLLPGLFVLVVSWLVAKKTGAVAPGAWRSFLVGARGLLGSPAGVFRVGGTAVTGVMVGAGAAYLVAQAFTATHVIIGVPFVVVLGGVVTARLATLVKLTPSGFGQYELAFAFALTSAGVGIPEAATLALLDAFFRHFIGFLFYIFSARRVAVRFVAVVRSYLVADEDPAAPRHVDVGRLSRHLIYLVYAIVALYLLDKLAFLLMEYWLFEQQGYASVFWTNFWMAAELFGIALVVSLFPIYPLYKCGVTPSIRFVLLHVEIITSLFDGLAFAGHWWNWLMSDGVPFNRIDPIFGNDIGFYIYTLPAYWTGWAIALRIAISTLLSWIISAWITRDVSREPKDVGRVTLMIGHVSRLGTRVTLLACGLIAAAGVWLARYDLLTVDNAASSVFNGAAYVDVAGAFSSYNGYTVLIVCIVVFSIMAFIGLGHLHRRVVLGAAPMARERYRRLVAMTMAPVVIACVFPIVVSLRQLVAVRPNEPVVQLPYIKEHIDATRFAYGFDKIETVRFEPARGDDPVPDLAAMMATTTLQNAPLWPGFCSYLEDLIDLQHSQRILQTGGDPLVYGPLLDVFRQQQQLRPYYDFLDADTLRYTIDGKRRMLVSAAREVPLLEPKPWLAWWGQRFMLYTHGLGLVTAFAGQVLDATPMYLSSGIPTRSPHSALQPAQQRIYYGEGAGSMAYTNVRNMTELDFPSDEGREVIWYPPDVDAGVHIDSLLKRLVFGYVSGQFFEVVFSDLITDDTRVHYYRTPLERAQTLLGPVFYDTDPYMVSADERLTWLVNGITYSEHVPYARLGELGDKSDSRSATLSPHVMANYVRDSIKVTMDAFTGQTRFYRIGDDPIAQTMSTIYPDLFTPLTQMTPAVREQLEYPVQLFHLQFDDLYIYYHMTDPMTFFNMEDMFDDADEVLGAIVDSGLAMRFSIEPYYMMVTADGAPFPASKERDQFALAMVFTPEGSWNLRSVPVVYQDGEDYGRIVNLQVPKGYYTIGPEQADTIIDQSPAIAQEFTWWTRRGIETVRGHTSTLIIGNEVIFVEPVFLRSTQNPMPQMKRVIVVFRGIARAGDTLADALRAAIEAHQAGQTQ